MQDLKVTLIQTALHWENADANRTLFDRHLSGIAPCSTDLILLPEMFNTGFTMNAASNAEEMDGPTVTWMRRKAAEKKCVIAGSLIIKEKGNYFNRLVWMLPDGNPGIYDKRHLFRMANEHHTYTAGNSRLVVNLNGWRICPMICYDLRFPVWQRNRGDYDVLLLLANWPARRSFAWRQLLIARAIENQCYVAGVNRIGEDGNAIDHSGDSVVLDARGSVLSKIRPCEESAETVILSSADLEEYRKSFPVSMDADRFILD